MSIKRFSTTVIWASLLILVCIGVLNFLVDPYARYGTDLVDPLVVEPRRDKYTLLRDVPVSPEILLLGSSRAITLRPSLVEALTGRVAFNAAVTRATPLDYYVYANYALQTYGESVKLIVACVDLQAMHPTIVWNNPAWLEHSPLQSYAGDYQRVAFNLEELLTGLFSRQQARDSLKVLHRILSGETIPVVNYTPYGETLGWDTGVIHKPVQFNDRNFWQSFTHIPQKHFDDLERLFALVDTYNALLVLVFLPYEPAALAEMRQIESYVAVDTALRAFLAEQQATYDFTVVDLTDLDTWGGDPNGFIDDYYHMDQANADRVIVALLGEGGALSGAF